MNGFNFLLYLIFALLLSCRPSVDSTLLEGATEGIPTPQNIGLLTKSPSSEPTPRFMVQGNFKIGNTVGIYNSSTCSENTYRGSNVAQNNTTVYITSLPLTKDGVYTYWSKVTSRDGNSSSCSISQASYSYQTGQTDIVLTLNTPQDANLNPLVTASNVSIGASVFIFTDSSCLKLAGSESFVSSSIVEIPVDDGVLTNDGPYTFYARQVLGNVNGPCSGTTPPPTYILNTKPTFMQTITPSPGMELRPSIRVGNGDDPDTAGALVPGAHVRIFNNSKCENNTVGEGTAAPNETTVLITIDPNFIDDNKTYQFWSTQQFGNHESPCSIVFAQYDLDTRPTISLVTATPGDNPNPLFTISGLQKGSTALLFEGEVCQGDEVGQVVSSGTSASVQTNDPLTGSGPYAYSAKQILPDGFESTCSRYFVTYIFDSPDVFFLTASPNNILAPELMVVDIDKDSIKVNLYSGSNCGGAPLLFELTGGNSSLQITVPDITSDGTYFYSIDQSKDSKPGKCMGSARYIFDTMPNDFEMVDPIQPIGNSATPTFRVANIIDYATATVTLHNNSNCSDSPVGIYTGLGPKAEINVSTPITSEGAKEFYALQTIAGVTSICSKQTITYEFDLKPPVVKLAGPANGSDPTPAIIVDKILNEGFINIYTGKNGCETLVGSSPAGNDVTRTIISSPLTIQGNNTFWANQMVNGVTSACSKANVTYNFSSVVGNIFIITDNGALPVASGQSNTPLIEVRSVAIGAFVELFIDNACTTTIGNGTSTSSVINIRSFPLSLEGEHKYYSRQTIDGSKGPCSSSFATYTLDTTPNSPILLTSSPNTILTPTLRVIDVIPGSQIKLFKDANCADLVGEAQAISSQVDVSVNASNPLVVDGNYYFYVKQVSSGHISPCSKRSEPVYTLDTRPKSIAILTIPNQSSPVETWNDPTPTIRVFGVEPGANVILFKDQNCQVAIGSGISLQDFIDVEVVNGSFPSDGIYGVFARQSYRGHTSFCSGITNPIVGATYNLDTSISLKVPGPNPNNLLMPNILAANTVASATVSLFSDANCSTGNEISSPTPSLGGDTTILIDPAFIGDGDKTIFGKQIIAGFDSPCSNQLIYSLSSAPTITLETGTSPTPGNNNTPSFILANLIFEPSAGTATVTIFDDINCANSVSSPEIITGPTMTIIIDPIPAVGNKTYYASQAAPDVGHLSNCSPQGEDYDYDLSPIVSMVTPSPSDELKPTVQIKNIVIGADVNLFDNLSCSNLIGSASSATSTEVSITLNSDLKADGRYSFYAQQSIGLSTSDCSTPATYDLETDNFIVAPEFSKDTTITPNVIISNLGDGDRIKLYFDDLCILEASSEATVTGSEVTLVSFPLSSMDKIHTWYAIRKIGNEGFQSRCVGPSLPYELNIMPTYINVFSTPNPGVNLQPEFEVQGINNFASVTIYTDQDCTSGNEIGSADSGPSTSVIVKTGPPLTSDGNFTVWARQLTNNQLSDCSDLSATYQLNTTPQGLSLGLGTTSPDDNSTPRIRVDGVVASAKVEIYLNDNCTTTVVGTGVVASGDNFIEIDSFPMGQDGSYNFWARQTLNTDPPYVSPCSASSTNYVLDTRPTNLISLTTMPSAQASPKILVEGVGPGDLVELFRDIGCTALSGSNISSGESIAVKVLPSLPTPGTYSFYAKRTQSGGLGIVSNCSSIKTDFEFNPALNYQWEFSQQVQKDVQNIGDLAGSVITGSEDYLVMGVPGETGGGQIYFWQYNGFFWESKGSLTPGVAGGLFGSSLDLYTKSADGKIANGDLLIVGAPGENSSTGAAYIYTYQNGTWVNEQKLIGSSVFQDFEFGASVAINQSMALIGAPGSISPGTVRSFENRNGNFTVESAINPPITLSAGDGFGYALELNDNNALISAPLNGRDIVFIYNIQSKVPVFSTMLAGLSGSQFGYAVDLSNDFAIIGAPNEGSGEGRSYIYLTSNWSQINTLNATVPILGGRFGESVSITSGQNEQGSLIANVIVGEPGNDTGQAYIFSGNDFIPVVNLPLFNNVSGDLVGASVFILNNNILVGAPGANGSGTVYIYRNDL